MTIINGITELRIFTDDITKEVLIKMTSEELKELINTGLINTIKSAYAYDTNNFGTDSGINIKVNYKEADKTEPIASGMLRIVALVEIPEKVACDYNLSDIGDLTLKINGNSFGCMNGLGYQTFEYSPEARGSEGLYVLSLETNFKGGRPRNLDLYKNKTVYFLNSKKECVYSINNLENNIRLDEKYNVPQDVWFFLKKALLKIL